MPITNADIKLMQPERLTDNDDGGGQMTGLQVIDGDINNLFEDISRVDRTYGNVSLRKSFLKVDTPTADLYLDAHSILSAQPADPRVTGLLFTTEDFYDERGAARQRVESFVIPGPVTGLQLRGNQLQGQKSIIVYAPTVNGVPAPEIGETYMLMINDDLETQQFIKVLSVEQSQETFTYEVSGGSIRTFTADQYVMQLSAELRRDYQANDPNPKPGNPSKIYSTQPANSAKYYGTTTLAETAEAGSTSIKVSDTFAPIIPTASNETPVIDQRPGGFLSQVVPIGPGTISFNVSSGSTATTLPTGIVPGTVQLTYGGQNYSDKGGILVDGSGNAGIFEGSAVNYFTGEIDFGFSLASSAVLEHQPGVLRQQLPNTGRIDIGDTNRNFNYVLSLDPAPAPGTLHVSYRYLGKWYELRDAGTGDLVGDGSGQVNYDTGSVVITLQAQPDASSVIFYRWTEAGIYSEQTADGFTGTSPLSFSLVNGSVTPGSVVITWETGGVEKTATDIGGDGTIGGDATGQIYYSGGRIILNTFTTPDSDFTVAYNHKDTGNQSLAQGIPNNTTQNDITLETAANIQPGSVSFVIRKKLARIVYDDNRVELSRSYKAQDHSFRDNGQGNIINTRMGIACGTINYTTGQIIVAGDQFLEIHNPV